MDVEHRQLVQLLPLLPLLAELGRTEHITETAEILGLPQSTVSRAIARASAIVGTDLVIRDGRGVRLTPAAKALLPHIDAALAEFQTGLDVVRHESEVVRGRIAVSFQHTFGEAMLPLLISAFRSRHPQTAFDLSQGARDGCLAELAAGSADLALTAPVAAPGRSIGSAALYREPLRLVVNHRHPLARRLRARVADIRHEPFVAMGTGYGMRSLTDALFREAGFRPRIAFESQDSHTVRGLVSAGLGVSILPPGGSAPGRRYPSDGNGQGNGADDGGRGPAPHVPSAGNGVDDGGPGWVEIPLDSALAFREIGLAWRERRGGADAEPDPVRLFRELVLRDGPALLAGFVRERSEG
ncbi:LysR family transcriptional regulator [Arthrobacter humicola]|uniref:LysR family transcriptional regulator n=1 Tax=Arthrobacter humicola TaxID=409291 RepID=UPI0031E24CFC